jgi:hypothetical protein
VLAACGYRGRSGEKGPRRCGKCACLYFVHPPASTDGVSLSIRVRMKVDVCMPICKLRGNHFLGHGVTCQGRDLKSSVRCLKLQSFIRAVTWNQTLEKFSRCHPRMTFLGKRQRLAVKD